MEQEEEFDLDAAIEAVAETMDSPPETSSDVPRVGHHVGSEATHDGPDWVGMSDEEFAAALKKRDSVRDRGYPEGGDDDDADIAVAGLTNAELAVALRGEIGDDLLEAELDEADRQQADADRARRLQAARERAAMLRERIDASLRAKVDGGPRTYQEAQELAESQTVMARLSDEQFRRLLRARSAGAAGIGDAVDEAGLSALYGAIRPREAE